VDGGFAMAEVPTVSRRFLVSSMCDIHMGRLIIVEMKDRMAKCILVTGG